MPEKLDRCCLGCLLGPDSEITPRNSINASFRAVDIPSLGSKRWLFQDVLPGGIAERAGIKPGDALIKVDGAAVLPPDQPAFVMGKVIPIEVVRDNETRAHDLDLKTPAPKYKDNPYSEPSSVVGHFIQDGIAVVKVSLFPGKIGIDFANELTHLFQGKFATADRLLIDLRGNPGGGIGGLRLMSLTPDKHPVGYSLDRKMAEKGVSKDSLPRLGKIPSQSGKSQSSLSSLVRRSLWYSRRRTWDHENIKGVSSFSSMSIRQAQQRCGAVCPRAEARNDCGNEDSGPFYFAQWHQGQSWLSPGPPRSLLSELAGTQARC